MSPSSTAYPFHPDRLDPAQRPSNSNGEKVISRSISDAHFTRQPVDIAYTEGRETLQVRWYYNDYSSGGGGGEERRPFVASTKTTSRGRATEISSSAFKMTEGGISLALPLLITALVRRVMC